MEAPGIVSILLDGDARTFRVVLRSMLPGRLLEISVDGAKAHEQKFPWALNWAGGLGAA